MPRDTWEGDVTLFGAKARCRVVAESDGRIRVYEDGEEITGGAERTMIMNECLRRLMRWVGHARDTACATSQAVQRGGDVAKAYEAVKRAVIDGPDVPAAVEVAGRKRAPGGDGDCG